MDESAALRPVLRVPLNGFAMQLRPSELVSVAAGLPQPDRSQQCDLLRLAEVLGQLPVNDRAPVWELAVRHFGRGKELDRAAGEIGMDVVHARDLVDALVHGLAAAARLEQTPTQTL